MRRSERKPASTCFLLQGIAKIVATDLMCLSRIRVHVFLITLLALFLPSLACGQAATSVNNSESTPVPGVGHNYINFLSETVDPGNGSLNVQIQVPVPPSRSLTIPFSIAYDSNGNFHIQDSNPPGSVTGATDASYVSSHGWSYSAPLLSYYNTYNSAKWQIQNGIQIYSTCEYLGDFIFTDPSGGRHSLYLAYLLPNQTNFCHQATTPTSSSLSDTGVVGGYQAYMVIANGSSGQVYVASPDGTVYLFDVNTFNMPELNGDGTPKTPPTTSYSLPSSIEDRNGNLANIFATGPNTNYDGSSTPIWFPLAYADSAGRTAVSTSGFGANGNTITVSGISSPYTVSWGTNPFSDSPSYTLGTQKLDTLSTCANPAPDPAGGSGSGVSSVTSITLPNGHSYQIFYDSTSGRVGKIIYPTGGYVQYVWGPNRLSDVMMFPSSQVNPVTGPLCEDRYDTVAVIHRYVSYDGTTIALQQDFSYSTTWDTSAPFIWDSKQTTVTTHDLVAGITYQTVYNYSSSNQETPPNQQSSFAAQLPIEKSIIYKAPNGTVLRTEYKSWVNRSLLASSCQTLDNNMTSGVFYAYSAGNQLADKKEYDFGVLQPGVCTIPSATPTRETVINYRSFANTPIYTNGPSIFDRPSTVVVKDANGNTTAETDYSYDQASVGSVSTTDHDETNYSASSSAPRGNATTVTRKCLQSCMNQVATYTFDETGQITKMTDSNNNATQYSYADSYTSGTPPGNTDAYLTQVTMPVTNGVSHIENFSYGYADGQLTQSKDQNSQISRYTYADSLGRLTETDYPDGGQTLISYNDTPPTPSITTQKLIKSGQYMTAVGVMDGMGHVTDSELTSDPAGTDYTATTYDGLGRPYTVTNPYRNTSDPTYGITTYTYDALGRTTQITHPDGSKIQTSYTGRATEVTDEGNGTKSVQRISQTDALDRLTSVCEVSSATQLGTTPTPVSCGQDIAGTGFLTTYAYDALDNLLRVTQGGLNSRTFAYDSLSRLTSATNPESGATSYAYDANGNLVTKADARSITTTYTYDALNRLLSKTYSDGTTPSANFTYDASSEWGVTLTNPIGRLALETADNNHAMAIFSYDPMGRTANEWQCTPLNCGSGAFSLPYTYDDIGDILTATNGEGVTFTSIYNAAAQLTSMTSSLNDSNHPGTLLSNVAYNPLGATSSSALGNGLGESETYDHRGRLLSMSANGAGGTPGTASVTISGSERSTMVFPPGCRMRSCAVTVYDNGTVSITVNGFVASASYFQGSTSSSVASDLTSALNGSSSPVTATVSGSVITLTSKTIGSGSNYSLSSSAKTNDPTDFSGSSFSGTPSGSTLTGGSGSSLYNVNLTYEPNSDIQAANDTANGNWTYTYDDFNRLASANATGQAYTYAYDRFGNRWQQNGPHTMMLTFSGANNRMDGYSYDAAGNVLNDGSHSYTYDAENRIVTVDGGGTTYVYNANGQRVRKTVGGVSTDYIYDLAGHAIAEVSASGWQRGEVYAGGRHLATYANSTTYFDHGDWLGTERVRTAVNASVCESITSLPFGDGESTTGSCADASSRHFTGKERDTESNLDNFDARYNSSQLGRFMSADPDNAGADPTGPQSWNMYSYVLNNPLNAVDPTGLDCIYLNADGTGVDHVLNYASTGIENPDCASDTDNGYYVNGTVDQSSISFGAGYMAYQYTAAPDSPNGSMPTQLGGACVDTCPGTSVTVNASVGPDTPTMSADPSRSLFLPLQFSFTPMTNPWERFLNTAACGLGLDPALAGPMLNSGTPNHDPGNSTRETEGQTRAQIMRSNGRPDKYGNGRLKSLNPRGNRNAGTASAGAGIVNLAANALTCAVNARQQ